MGLLGDLLRLLCALAKYIVSKYICGGSIEEDIYRTPGNPYNADVLPSTVTHRPQVRQQHSPACLQRPPLYPPPPLPPRPAQSHRVQGHSQAEGNTAPTYLPTPPLYPSPPLPPKREQHHRPQEHAQVPGTLRTSPPSVFASAGAELRGEFNRNRVGQRAVHAIELRTRANAASEQKGRSLVEANHAHERGDGVRKREQTNAARTEIERWREHAAKRVLQPYNAVSRLGTWTFRRRVAETPDWEVNLHGSYVRKITRAPTISQRSQLEVQSSPLSPKPEQQCHPQGHVQVRGTAVNRPPSVFASSPPATLLSKRDKLFAGPSGSHSKEAIQYPDPAVRRAPTRGGQHSQLEVPPTSLYYSQFTQQPTPVYTPTKPPYQSEPQPAHLEQYDPLQGHAHARVRSKAASPPPPISLSESPWSPEQPDWDQINERNDYYVGLRARAKVVGNEMARSFEESQVAYQLGNHGRARELSEAGNAARLEMERLNEEASEGIFKVNNINSQPGEVDLHGLYVGEAIRYADQAVQKAIARGDSKIRLVVGKGLHSTAGMPKLKPAVEKYLREKGHEAEVDERNPGVLVVSVGDEPMDCSW